MIISIILTLLFGILGGYYAYKTVSSAGHPIGGLPMLVMRATSLVLPVWLVVGFINIGWKILLTLPIVYLVAYITKTALLYFNQYGKDKNI